jgi:hypothetical protein
MAGSWYLKWTFCFMATTHELLHLDKQSFVLWKIVDIPTCFIWIIIFFNGPFEYGDGGIFKLLRWMQNLHQSMWDDIILYSNRYLEDEQILIRPLLWKSKNMNMVDIWQLKLTFYFMESTHELLYLVKWSFVHWKIMDIPTGFIWIIIFFDGALEYGSISNLWVMLGQTLNYFV